LNHHAKLIVALGVLGLVGIVVVALILGTGLPAGPRIGSAATLDEVAVATICSSASSGEPNFYADIAGVNARMHVGMEIAPSGDVDRDFALMMIPHHQGAIDMAVVMLKYGRDARLRRLAQSIIIEQGHEIAYMRTLLQARPDQTPDANRIAGQ
jgi:Domain of unknown function (DUF305)